MLFDILRWFIYLFCHSCRSFTKALIANPMSEFESKVFNDMLTNNHYGITRVETVTNNISVCLLTVLEFNLLKLQNLR